MSSPTPPDEAAAIPESQTVAELTAALRDSEARLRELTAQCLGFLDELGEARRKEDETQALLFKVDKLQNLLADSRRQLQSAGSTVLRPSSAASAGSLEVFVWGGIPEVAPLRSLVENMAGVPVTCVLNSEREENAPADSPDSVQWFRTASANTPAQAWNVALGATNADAILMLHAGAVPEAGGWAEVPVGDGTTWAVQPRVTEDGAVVDRFLRGDEFDDAPPASGGKPVRQTHVDPRAFVLQRDAAESVGTFDEDLLGPLALVDYGLRANERGFRAVGWPEVSVAVDAVALATDKQVDDRDRLLTRARFRPSELGLQWARSPFLWSMDQPERGAFFRALMGRIPDANRWPQGIDILGSIAEGMIRGTFSSDQFDEKFDPLLREKLESLAAMEHVSVHDLWPELLTEKSSPAETFERVAALSQLEQNVRDVLEARYESVRSELEAAHAAQSAAEQAREAAEQARDEAEQTSDSLRGSLASIAEAIQIMGEPHPAQVRQRLVQMQADATRLTELLAAADAPDPAALIRNLYNLRQQLSERDKWIVALLRQSQKTRLSPLPRKLQSHEIDFIDRIDGKSP